jgi:hypothetical protein
MITIKTMKQIATSRVIPGCRSLARWGTYRFIGRDRARIAAGVEQMKASELRRLWTNRVDRNDP